MKKPFKRKIKKVKLSEGKKFLGGLSEAVRFNQDREKYEKHFLAIVNKGEELDNSKTTKTPPLLDLKKIIEDNKKIEPIYRKNPNKYILWFNKFKLKLKESWEISKEFGREIQYWLIAEFKIFTKLSYSLNRKKDEIKVRKAFKNNKLMFISRHGYDKGTHLFNDFSTSINNSVRMHKRMEKREINLQNNKS